MPKAPASITSPKIKKLAAKALKSPSMLTTEETRQLGSSVMAHLSPVQEAKPTPAKKSVAKKSVAKKTVAKKTVAKWA